MSKKIAIQMAMELKLKAAYVSPDSLRRPSFCTSQRALKLEITVKQINESFQVIRCYMAQAMCCSQILRLQITDMFDNMDKQRPS